MERLERQFLADRTGLATAAQMSGEEVTPPSWDEQLAEFDAALARKPEPVTERGQRNHLWLKALGAA